MKSEVLPKRLFSEVEASYYLGVSKHTLRKQRSDGQRENHMPVVPYILLGRKVLYVKDDLDLYIEGIKALRIDGGQNNGS